MSDLSGSALHDLRHRVVAWLKYHRGLVDAALALSLWLLFALSILVIGLTATPGGGPLSSPVPIFLVTSLQTLALTWRRTRPDASFALVVLGHLGQLVVTHDPLPSNVTALMSAYAVARYSSRVVVRRAALATAITAGVAATLDWQGYGDSITAALGSTLFLGGLAVVSWLGGDLTRKRRELVSRLQEQNEALRRDRDQRARLAAQDERTRIAREMHDIVAHSLSVVVVQADGAAYTAMHTADFHREQAEQALQTIATTAREALAETRRLVGVLRTTESQQSGGQEFDYAPTETLADLPELVSRMGASGIDVALDAPSDLAAVPRESGLAAYRIVQEAMTNVIKHAGPHVRVLVRIEVAEVLHLQVCDDGRGAAASDDGHGHGLIGMRERAASVGGTVSAGPGTGGGYLVTATLPLRQERT